MVQGLPLIENIQFIIDICDVLQYNHDSPNSILYIMIMLYHAYYIIYIYIYIYIYM